MKELFIALLGSCAMMSYGAITGYGELIGSTIQACDAPEILLGTAFTNDLANYRSACTGGQERCAADLALALSLMQRLDNDENCVGSIECYEAHQALVSNIVASVDLDDTSWIKYAAGMEYARGLNYGSRFLEGLSFTTNMLARLSERPCDLTVTNYWAAMMRLCKAPMLVPADAFRLNAAILLADQNRWAEVVVYTNSLPASAVELFVSDLE